MLRKSSRIVLGAEFASSAPRGVLTRECSRNGRQELVVGRRLENMTTDFASEPLAGSLEWARTGFSSTCRPALERFMMCKSLKRGLLKPGVSAALWFPEHEDGIAKEEDLATAALCRWLFARRPPYPGWPDSSS